MKKIAVWHESPVLAEGLCLLLKACFTDCHVHVVRRWSQLSLKTRRSQKILLIWVDQPVLEGVGKLTLMRKAYPGMPCVFLTRLHPRALQCMVELGPWDGVVDSALPVSLLMQSLREWLDKAKTARLAEPWPELASAPAAPERSAATFKMTRRYQELLLLAIQGYTNARIASALGVSEQTVKAHFWRMYQALGVKSRMQAIHKLRTLGYLGGSANALA